MLSDAKRPRSFYLLAAFFLLFVLFLYGPLSTIVILSFQGPDGGLTFPMNGASFTWFKNLFEKQAVGDFGASFKRSFTLGLMVMIVTVAVSLLAGLAFRRKFRGATALFYATVASLVVPSIIISLGIGLLFRILGILPAWYSSAFGAHLTWTLPFGLLIMFAVLNRFDSSWEEAARDAGATPSQILLYVTLPILFPGLIAVALFGFTLSYDEFPRSLLTLGTRNSLPLEVANMTSSVTTPALYAIGTITTVISLAVIAFAFSAIAVVQRRRSKRVTSS